MSIFNESEEKSARELKGSKIPIPSDFEKGVVVRTFLSQLPSVPAPKSFEDDVLMRIAAVSNVNEAKQKYSWKNVVAGGVIVSGIISAGIWFYDGNKTDNNNNQPKYELNQHVPATHIQESTTIQNQSVPNTVSRKSSKEPKKQNFTIQRKNDSASPVPGFKAESKGEHEED